MRSVKLLLTILVFLGSGTFLFSQTNVSVTTAQVISTFPQTVTNVTTTNGGSATNMQGACFTLPCCSVAVYKVVLPSDGVLRVEMTNFAPLAGSIIAYRSTVANPTSFADLAYISGSPGNFCGFRDTLLLGRAFAGWDNTPYGQVPSVMTGLTSVYDFNNPGFQSGYYPAGDYYLLVFVENQQTGQGAGNITDLTFEFAEACAPLTAPSSLTFGDLEYNGESDTLSFYLKNERDLDITIDANTGTRITGSDSAEFSILTAPNTNIAVNDSSLVEIVFVPTSGGAKNATLSIEFSDTSCTATTDVTLTGSGAESDIVLLGNGSSISNNDLTPSNSDFTDMGDVVTNTGSLTREFVITNTGADTLELTGNPLISLTGSAQFVVSTLPSTIVLPGDSTTFGITFTPLVDGFDTIDVSIASNDPDENPFVFRVRAQGAERNGLNFDGSSDYVNINAVSNSMAGATSFTLESWINVSTSQSGNDRILGVNTSSNGTRFLVTIDDGILEFFDNSTSFTLSSTNLKDGAWHHIALIYNNGTLQTLLDGSTVSIHATDVLNLSSLDKWSIGQEFDGSSASDFFRGSINDFRLWNSARSNQEVLDNRYCELTSSYPDLVAYYTCNQGIAGGNNTAITTLTDASGNGFNGNLISFSRTGTTSNFIAATEVGVNCTSFRVDECGSSAYTSPSGKSFTASGLYIDTVPNGMGGDSILYIDLAIGQATYTQDILGDTTTCDTLTGPATTEFASFAAFNKSDDHWVEINEVAPNLAGTNRSVFTWMRQSAQVSGSAQVLVGINTSSGGNVSLLLIGTNEQLGVDHGSSSVSSGTVVTDGIWHYVGYTYDESNDKTRVYVDGVEVDDFTNSQTVSTVSQISLGQEFDSGNSKGNFFQGEMTEVSIWSEVLDTNDIKLAMQGAITSNHPKYGNLEAYYPMIESCGDTNFTVTDYSGNGFHGIPSSGDIVQTDTLAPIAGFNGAGWFQKEWKNGGATVSTADTLLQTPAVAGNYVLRLHRDRFEVVDSFAVALSSGCAPSVIAVVASAAVDSNVTCNGLANGGATVSVSSGTPPYSYLWSNGLTTASATGLAAGAYSVVVTDSNSQRDTAFVTITEPAVLMAGPVVDSNVSCNGLADGGASSAPTGGTGPYTYAWSNGAMSATITGLTAGSYTITVTDSKGCTDTASVSITEPTGPVADFTLNPALGQSTPHNVFFTDQSTQPDTWNWNFGDGNNSTLQNPVHSYTSLGLFTVTLTVTDTLTGCSSSASDSVLVCNVTAMVLADSNATCNGDSDGGATAAGAGGTGPYTYAWSNSASSASISGVPAGTYTVTVTDVQGCFDTASVTITQPTAITALTVVDSNVTCNGDTDGGATAAGTGGTPMYSFAWSNNGTTASISGVAAGTYSVTITDLNGCFDSASVTVTEPAVVIAATVVDSNASCNGDTDGGATAAATGGSPPYSYLWSNSATTASISGVAAGTYSVTITDFKGCFDSASVTVTEPAVMVAAAIVDSNVTCNGDMDGGATAAATGGSPPYSYQWSNGATTASLSGVAAGTYSVTVTDFRGCFDSASVTITQPNTMMADAIVDSNVTCNGGLDGGATASGSGGTPPYSYQWSNGGTQVSISGVTAGIYSVTVTDFKGCFDSASVTVTQPTAVMASAVVDSNETCAGDNDGGVTASAFGGTPNYTYLWSNNATTASLSGVGAGTYTVTIMDSQGCTDTAQVSVTIEDNIDPVAAAQNLTVYLDASGQASITTSDFDNGSSDNCGIAFLALDVTSFTCVNAGANTVTLTATDGNGNTDTAQATVTVLDTLNPVAMAQNVTVYLDAAGQASITTGDIDNGSSDNCSITSLALDVTSFTCADVGANTVILTTTDGSNNTDTAMATVMVMDTLAPTVVTQNVTIYLDGSGQASITTGDIDNGSSDNCGIASLALNTTSFTCSEVGTNTVQLTATDVNGNVDSATATVTVMDTLTPTAVAQNITVYLDGAGQASITTGDIDNGSSDNCTVASLALNTTSFTCADVGANMVVLTVTDVNSNTDTAHATVTVMDTLAPNTVTQNVTVYLDAAGTASITTGDIDNGSTDNCGLASLALDVTSFTCAEVGTNTVVLTATDVNGNSDTAHATVMVMDTVLPNVVTQNITVYLDAAGSATIVPADVDNGSSDNCTIASQVLDITSFTCAEVGPNTVWLTVTDVNGNADSATATVMVMDTLAPNVVTQNITVYLDAAGQTSITTGDVDNGSSDNCAIASQALDITSFTCAEVGPNTVWLTVTDFNGNSDSATATVTVMDTLSPLVATQNITVYLDAAGAASITTGDIDNGSSDNCGIASLSLDITSFSCAEVGANSVVLTATDVNSNTDTAHATVMVMDTLNPLVATQNITVYLDAAGAASIVPGDVDNGSSDNCTIDTRVLDISSFSCADVGANTVVLTVTDVNSNSDTAHATVTVMDTLAPNVVTQNVTVYLDANGQASITTGDIDNGSSDNCSIASLALDSTAFDCGEVGANPVVLTATDVNGNSDTAHATVTVMDTILPTVIGRNVTVYLDGNGQASIDVTDVDSASFDNCGIDSVFINLDLIDCGLAGTQQVTLFARDVNGNLDSAVYTLNVLDTISPTITCPVDVTVCDNSVLSYPNPVVVDNCNTNLTLLNGPANGSTVTVGNYTVEIEVEDAGGNTETCTFNVDVVPNPTVDLGTDLTIGANSLLNFEVDSNFSDITWSTGANTPSIDPVVTMDTSFSVTVVDSNGCVASDTINIAVLLSNGKEISEGSLQLFPNPTRGPLSLRVTGTDLTDLQVVVVDMNGKEVQTLRQEVLLEGQPMEVDMSNLSRGVYFIRILSNEHKSIQRVIRQ